MPIVEIILVILGSILYFAANIQRVAVPGAVFDVLQTDLVLFKCYCRHGGCYFPHALKVTKGAHKRNREVSLMYLLPCICSSVVCCGFIVFPQ